MSELSQPDPKPPPASGPALEDVPVVERRQLSFDPNDLEPFADQILGSGGPRAIRMRETLTATHMVLVARHDDAKTVLTDDQRFSLGHYQTALSAIAPRDAHLLLEDYWNGRDLRYAILHQAMSGSPFFEPRRKALRRVSRQCVDDLIDNFRSRPEPQFDIIGEFGFLAPHMIAGRVFGLGRAPRFDLLAWLFVWLKYDPLPSPFSRPIKSYLRQCAWAQLAFAQLFANFENRNRVLSTLGRWGFTRLSAQVRRDMEELPDENDADAPSLLHTLLKARGQRGIDKSVYDEHVLYLMLEIVGTALVLPGSAFAGIVTQLSATPGLLDKRLALLNEKNGERWVNETLRLAPAARFMLRRATQPVTLNGLAIDKGEYVGVLLGRAGSDPRAIADPDVFKLDRSDDIYLHFGPPGGPHSCLGRNVVPTMLAEMFLGLKRLRNLAPDSPLKTFRGTPVHWRFRFDPDGEE